MSNQDDVLATLAAAAAGDLTARAPTEGAVGSNDSATVAHAVNHTLQALGSVVADLDRLAGDVAGAVHRLAPKGEELGTGSGRQAAAIAEIARRVHSLGARSDEMGQVVEMLDDVTAETNVLALNAAIEAARSGPQGKGFGILADEVRKLAERSSVATKDIAAFIQTVESVTTDTAHAVDDVRATADRLALVAAELTATLCTLGLSVAALLQALGRVRIPGRAEGDLARALRDRAPDIARALHGIGPLLGDADAAGTPLGEALRRVMEAAGAGPDKRERS